MSEFDDWVKETLRIEGSEITHLSPEEQKDIKFTVTVGDLIKLWNAGVVNGLKGTSNKQVRVRHKKTGNVYWIIAQDIIECTNGREELKYVLYENIVGQLFCREQNEFWVKFENA